MIIVNKLIVFTKDENLIQGINNVVRNENGDVDLRIITKIPEELVSFNLDNEARFDHIVEDLYKETDEEEFEIKIKECEEFMSEEDLIWLKEAINLKKRYGNYNYDLYFKSKTNVSLNDILDSDGNLPKNTRKQFSFYTRKTTPMIWVRELSKIFSGELFELHYKEKSQLKYKKMRFKEGKLI